MNGKRIAIVVAAAVIGLAVAAGARRPSTPAIRDGSGRWRPNSIASLEKVRIGGSEQWLLIRGADRNKPVLLFIHGGPGLPLMPLAHEFEAGLEQDFVVVQWDQRDSGKSYSRSVDPSTLNEEQFISDTAAIIKLLRARFHQPKIFLLGHSWGSYLAMRVAQRYPQWIAAYIGVGQMAFRSKAPALQKQFVLRQARRQGAVIPAGDLADDGKLRDWVLRFGGDIYFAHSRVVPIRMALGAHEYTPLDYAKSVLGLGSYRGALPPSLWDADPAASIPELQVPVYMFAGERDYICPTLLTERYFQQLRAPRKRLFLMSEAAHFPFLEKPAEFAADMRKIAAEVLSAAR